MPNAKTGNTTTISIGGTAVGEVLSIKPVSPTIDPIETTNLDSTAKEFIPSPVPDYGEITINGNFFPSNTGQAALRTAFTSKTTDTYIITFPSTVGATWTFTGFITGYDMGEADNENPLSFAVTVKITGAATFGLTDSGGLSALSCTGAGGSLSPAFAAANRHYTYGAVSASSITVTPTAASHTIALYVNGVFVENVTSGAASSAITLTLNRGTLITLICYEAAKSPITYSIVAVKTS